MIGASDHAMCHAPSRSKHSTRVWPFSTAMPVDLSFVALIFGLLCVSLGVPNCLRLRKGGQLNRFSRDECSKRLLPLFYVFHVADKLCALLEDGRLCTRLRDERFCVDIAGWYIEKCKTL